MSNKKSKYIIVGAGLSGLCAGYYLQKAGESDFIILESRNRVGGRIDSKIGVDFGATWFQAHHEAVVTVLDEVGLGKFPQYTSGKSVLVYNSMAPAHEFESDPSAPSAFRITGGTMALIDALSSSISEKIIVNRVASEIEQLEDKVRIHTQNGTYEAEKIIVTIPPRIAAKIAYKPELPEQLLVTMNTTHTWMSNAIKVGLTFDRPFWRINGYSGTLLGQGGAVTELYDHSSIENSNYALMGFVNEGLRVLSPSERKNKIVDYISAYLGEEVRGYKAYHEKDWSNDTHTSCDTLHSVYISPQYGKPELQQWYMGGRLRFAGAETATVYGGYMDGALRSGIIAAKKLVQPQD